MTITADKKEALVKKLQKYVYDLAATNAPDTKESKLIEDALTYLTLAQD